MPEFPMGARKLGRLGCGLGVRMTFIHGEISEYQTKALPQALLNAPDDWISMAAMGAFIIPILDQRASGVFIPLHVIRGLPAKAFSQRSVNAPTPRSASGIPRLLRRKTEISVFL